MMKMIALPLIAALAQDKSLTVGINEPYSPADRVYYTLERHARPRNTPCVMIELRNNEIASAETQAQWAERLTTIFAAIGNDLASQVQLSGSKA
jgi:predicted N-formylglutamate amidohydrolase